MACGMSHIILRLLYGFSLLTLTTFASATCLINAENSAPTSMVVALKEGEQRVSLSCNVGSPHVLYFPRSYLSYNQLYDSEMRKVPKLTGAFESYAIDRTHKLLFLDIRSQVERPITLNIVALQCFKGNITKM